MAGRKKTTGALLDREAIRKAILEVDDVQIADENVPEWGITVRIRGLTGTERDGYELWIIQGKGRNRDINIRQSRAKLVMMTIVDGEGKRVFDEADIVALGKKSALALQRVFDKAAALSGLDEETLEKIQDDLGNDPSDASGSA
jgi:hypothetical protein